jgi:hypothetical protein
MLASIIVALTILGALGYALKTGRGDDMITHRPYNNRYNDAAGARDHTLFE